MTFLFYLIDLIKSFLYFEFLKYWFFPLLAISFLATIPVIVRKLFL